jgi:hypothetical protein
MNNNVAPGVADEYCSEQGVSMKAIKRVTILALFATAMSATSAFAQVRELPFVETADHRLWAGMSIVTSLSGAALAWGGVSVLAKPGRHDLNPIGGFAVGLGGLTLGLGIATAVMVRRETLLVERGRARWDPTPWSPRTQRAAAAALYIVAAGFAGHATYELVGQHIQSEKCTTQRVCTSPLGAFEYGMGVAEYAIAAVALTGAVVAHVKARSRTDMSIAPTVGYRSAGLSARFVW